MAAMLVKWSGPGKKVCEKFHVPAPRQEIQPCPSDLLSPGIPASGAKSSAVPESRNALRTPGGDWPAAVGTKRTASDFPGAASAI
jgi:hypothetical protein